MLTMRAILDMESQLGEHHVYTTKSLTNTKEPERAAFKYREYTQKAEHLTYNC